MSNTFVSGMTGLHELEQVILNNLPHHVGVKDENSVIVCANESLAKTVGFKKASQLIGKQDNELNCDAAQFYQEFQAQDKEALNGHKQRHLDFGYYANNKLKAFLSGKSKVKFGGKNIILFSMTELPLKRITRLFGQWHEPSTFSAKAFCGSYSIKRANSAAQENGLAVLHHAKVNAYFICCVVYQIKVSRKD